MAGAPVALYASASKRAVESLGQMRTGVDAEPSKPE